MYASSHLPGILKSSHRRSFTGLGVAPPVSLLASLPTFATTVASGALFPMPITTPIATPGGATGIVATKLSLSQLSLPPKLIKKILDLELTDMSELVPDNWHFESDEQRCCHQSRRSQRKGPVMDILLWLECYSSLVTVLSSKFPAKIAAFMAYQRTIIKAHKTFIGEGWITYDTCYRRRAAITKSLEWDQVEFTLYNETFTGRAKTVLRCKYCHSEHHTSAACSYAPDNPSPRLDAAPYRDPAPYRVPRERSVPICMLYNNRYGNKCKFTPCKFAHRCSECQGSHPLADCYRNKPPLPKILRTTDGSRK